MVYPHGLGFTVESGGGAYTIWPMVMAIPLANKAGKFATLAAVILPPAFFVVPRPEVKSNNHCGNVLGGYGGLWEVLTSLLSLNTLRRANRVGAFWSPSKSSAVLLALAV